MERSRIDESINWIIGGYKCNSCGISFGIINVNVIIYCPYCGSSDIVYGSSSGIKLQNTIYCEPEQNKTPTQIVEEIKELYHKEHNHSGGRIDNSYSMEQLLNKLKEMAEKGVTNE